jgi:hypothetical protein
VDKDAKRITLIFPSSSFGDQVDLTGATLCLTTWDYDAAYRNLEAKPGGYVFGGAKSANDPKIMDAIGPFTIGTAPSK